MNDLIEPSSAADHVAVRAAIGTDGAPTVTRSFADLGDTYFARVAPTPLPDPQLIHCNRPLAQALGLDPNDPAFVAIMAGNQAFAPPADRADIQWAPGFPLASVYAGHQFGYFVPQLGDGRAHLIAAGRRISAADWNRWELQLKGSGPTPFSRFADGRAVLRSSIREYLCSEAMAALGIPTTRALSLVGSALSVRRETLETAAVVCRVAPSFVRIGHFEFFYHRDRHEALQTLADHIIEHHFPEVHALAPGPQRYRQWLTIILERTARLMAQWQTVGFCHGVMNTDNFSILGLTIDYGPFGFQDAFDPEHICNHSDEHGRYAWNQQPTIGHWNISRLLQACLPLIDEHAEAAVEIANSLLERFPHIYLEAVTARWAAKIGLREVRDGDRILVNRLLQIMQRSRADFTRSFRNLAQVRSDRDAPAAGARDEMLDIAAYDAWIADYRARLRSENSEDRERAARMNAVNPLYVLRNHLAQAAIERAERGDFSEIERLHECLSRPYTERPEDLAYANEPPPELRHIAVSCSS